MLQDLINRIINRVNVNLRNLDFDARPFTEKAVPVEQFLRFYGFYGLTAQHPLHFIFRHSSLAGSYFLGKCIVDRSVLYKSDIRGDELRSRGEIFRYHNIDVPLHSDEFIHIQDSFLIKTLVHNNSHDPERPEEFHIRNTIAMPYANIHGTAIEGGYLGPFATVDFSTVKNCIVGAFSYLQAGELTGQKIKPGQVWVRAPKQFDFHFSFDPEVLKTYIRHEPGSPPQGVLMDFVESRKEDFQEIFSRLQYQPPVPVPPTASLSRYAVVKGDCTISDNVLVAQRSYLENTYLGPGANTQEHCYVINSRLTGEDITAHGGKVINANLGKRVFVGFNSFLRGSERNPLTVGEETIIMPHTIIDLDRPLEIPPRSLVWGLVRNAGDLVDNSISLERLEKVDGASYVGEMEFRGDGGVFVRAFRDRIQHILEANGAFFDGEKFRGHAQKDQQISFNTIQPYPEGEKKGIYPEIEIKP